MTSSRRTQNTLIYAIAFLSYVALALFFFGPGLAAHIQSSILGQGTDPPFYIWAINWLPYALTHGLNAILTKSVWYPAGANLAWAASIPGVALLLWPLTMVAGPVVSYNVIALVALPLGALSMFAATRYIFRASPTVSWVAGYIFGFSSYEMAQEIGHMNLTLVFVAPLVVYLLARLWRSEINRFLFVYFAGGLLALQLTISTEIFADVSFFGAITFASAWIAAPQYRRKIIQTGLWLFAAYGFAVLIASPFLYYVVAFAPHSTTPPNSSSTYSTDLLNFFLPTAVTWLGGAAFHAVSQQFPGNLSEQGGYLGLPLLIILILAIRAFWGKWWASVLLVVSALVLIATLGPVLHIDGIPTITLPWAAMAHVPFIKDALPGRFMMVGSLLAALAFAAWVQHSQQARLTKIGWSLATILFLAPSLSVTRAYVASDPVPHFFTSSIRHYLPENANVLILPFGPEGYSMLYQVRSHMYFTMAEGGFLGPGVPSTMTSFPLIPGLLSSATANESVPTAQLASYLASTSVQAVLTVGPTDSYTKRLLARVSTHEAQVGQVRIYYVSQRVLNLPHTMVGGLRYATYLQFRALYLAATRYESMAGGGAGNLYPLQLEKLGLLSAGYGGFSRTASNWNWTNSGGWVGPWSAHTFAVGMTGTASSLSLVMARYSRKAAQIYYPYPDKAVRPLPDTGSGLLILVFRSPQPAQP